MTNVLYGNAGSHVYKCFERKLVKNFKLTCELERPKLITPQKLHGNHFYRDIVIDYGAMEVVVKPQQCHPPIFM